MSNPFINIPRQPKPGKLGQLSQEQVAEFFENGFLQVNDLIESSYLEPVKKETEALVDDIAQRLYKAGKITNLHADADLFHRLTLLNQEYPGATVLCHKIGKVPPAYQKLWEHEKLLNIMEQLVGPDVAGSPVWNLRPKAPNVELHDVPWHQDSAYFDESVNNVPIIAAWIPMLDTNEKNGCLQFLKGGHRTGVLGDHHGCWKDTWYVDLVDDAIVNQLKVDPVKDIVTARVPYGGAVFFTNLTPHRSLPNTSDMIRWSVDLRWQDAHSSMGLYGMKEGIVMRLKEQPDLQPDWVTFNATNRHDKQTQKTRQGDCKEIDDEDFFDTTLTGPWMQRWPITHHNRHTAKMAQVTA